MAIDLEAISDHFGAPENLTIKEVLSSAELNTWAKIMVKSFELKEPFDKIYKNYFKNLGVGKHFNGHYFLGILNGLPVASAVLFDGKEAAGIYYVGILPDVRRKGIAQAMIHHLLREAKIKGYETGVLQASQMGYLFIKN